MITNVSIVSVFVTDIDASKRFYIDVFGFVEKDDITMGNGYRWCGPMGSGRFEEAQDLSDLAYRVGSSHGVGLNYGNILEQRRTIEYRSFDSSLAPAPLQANTTLACAGTTAATTRHTPPAHPGGRPHRLNCPRPSVHPHLSFGRRALEVRSAHRRCARPAFSVPRLAEYPTQFACAPGPYTVFF